MTVIKTREIRANLLSKGFQIEESHHEFLWFYFNGKRTHIKTRLSHGKDEYGPKLISLMKKQVKLNSKKEVEDLLKCPMSEEKYIEILMENGELEL